VIGRDGGDLVVDCTEMTFIDSTGVHVLLEIEMALKALGRTMLVANIQPAPLRVLEILGLTSLLRDSRR